MLKRDYLIDQEMENTKQVIPPKFAKRFLLIFIRKELAEEVVGDLEEKFRVTASKKSLFRANLNYTYQVLHYMRPFAVKNSFNFLIPSGSMYKSYFKIGWRNLLKNKSFATINIGGLALAMTVSLLIGLWVADELSYNRYHTKYDSIAKVYRTENWNGEVDTSISQVTGLGTLLRESFGTYFKRVVMVRARVEDRVLSLGENKFTQQGYFMQPEGGELFSLRMKYGSRNGLQEMNSILLSATVAKKLFGDEDPVNRVISMDAKWDLKVTGVYEDLPRNSEFSDASYFAPLDRFLNGWATLDAWDNYNMRIYVELNAGVPFGEATAAIKDVVKPHVRDEVAATNPLLFLHPMPKWHLYSEFKNGILITSGAMKIVWFNVVIGVFVLLLACINFMNLSTARSERRAREVGIRRSIGSLRSQLVHQFLGESLLIAFIAFLFSLLLLALSLPLFNQIADKTMHIPWGTPLFWISAITFMLLTGILAGSYPAFFLSSVNTVHALKGTFKAGRAGKLPRRVLVVFQFTVSMGLIVGTLVVYDQIQFVKNRPLGYSQERLIELQPRSPEFQGKYNVLQTELKRTGAVEEMAEANYSVHSNQGWNSGFHWPGKHGEEGPSFNTIRVSHEYGKTIGWQFVEGRDFSREILTDQNAIVLNESAVRLMGIKDPIDQLIQWKPDGDDRGTYKVIGVVKDMVKGSPYEPTDPSIIFLSEQDLDWLYIKIKAGTSTTDALTRIQSAFNKVVPSAPFDYTFTDEAYNAKFRSEERVGTISGIFGGLTTFISCCGMFALASFMAEQRTKEISIRKVLGASIVQLWRLMSTEFVVLVILSCVIAGPLSYWLIQKWLLQYNYRTTVGLSVFGVTASGALLVTLITVSFQAIRTAMRNPVDSLKAE